jgi:NADH-quinone oxidoreductase subunit J
LAITLVLVYVGAVMVLFLFVVMMLDINVDSLRQGFWKHFPVAGTLGAVMALEMAAVVMGGFRTTETPKGLALNAGQTLVQAGAQVSNTKELGKVLYSQYIYPLEIAAVILLVAMIAAIALTLRERKDSKYTSPADQVRVKAADRMTVLKMDATRGVEPELVQVAASTDTVPASNEGKKA